MDICGWFPGSLLPSCFTVSPRFLTLLLFRIWGSSLYPIGVYFPWPVYHSHSVTGWSFDLQLNYLCMFHWNYNPDTYQLVLFLYSSIALLLGSPTKESRYAVRIPCLTNWNSPPLNKLSPLGNFQFPIPVRNSKTFYERPSASFTSLFHCYWMVVVVGSYSYYVALYSGTNFNHNLLSW